MSPLAHVMRFAILGYRYTLSSFLGRGCRFGPSCSEYALEAIAYHGAIRGGWLAFKRIARCHPWGGSGFDPVPGVYNRSGTRPSAATIAEKEKRH